MSWVSLTSQTLSVTSLAASEVLLMAVVGASYVGIVRTLTAARRFARQLRSSPATQFVSAWQKIWLLSSPQLIEYAL